jgi:hypothetical protein
VRQSKIYFESTRFFKSESDETEQTFAKAASATAFGSNPLHR